MRRISILIKLTLLTMTLRKQCFWGIATELSKKHLNSTRINGKQLTDESISVFIVYNVFTNIYYTISVLIRTLERAA